MELESGATAGSPKALRLLRAGVRAPYHRYGEDRRIAVRPQRTVSRLEAVSCIRGGVQSSPRAALHREAWRNVAHAGVAGLNARMAASNQPGMTPDATAQAMPEDWRCRTFAIHARGRGIQVEDLTYPTAVRAALGPVVPAGEGRWAVHAARRRERRRRPSSLDPQRETEADLPASV